MAVTGFAIVSGNDAGFFVIDANGNLSLTAAGVAAATNNFEALPNSFTLGITASDANGNTSVPGTITVSVTDVDEFDVTTPTDTNASDNTIAENASIGSTVGITANATDGDGSNNTIAYSLTDSAGGRFAINATTGVVTLASALNYETATSHNITVQATSSDGSSSSQTFTIAVSDVDEFNVSTPTDSDTTENTIAENASIGSTVGITANATDGDGSNNTIAYSLTDSAGGRFAINATSGVVTLASGLDYETATSHNITVQATSSDGSSSSQTFTIAVSDVDEFNVSTPTDTNVSDNTIAEDASIGSTVGTTANATDGDGSNITYSLTDDADGRFTIDSTTGVVTLASALNYETATSHNITVQATSSDGSSSSQNFTIAVSDVDEFNVSTPTDTNVSDNTIAENASIGSTVGITANATDGDGSNNTIAYSLTDSAGGRFAINATTGVVTLASALDYETATSHNIIIQATSSDGSSSSQTFTIAVTDVNEAPRVTLANIITSLPEDADTSQRIKVADIIVTDDALGTANLSLSGEDATRLVIDGTELYFEAGVNLDLDFETSSQLTLDVAVVVDDPSVGTTPDDTVNLPSIAITNVNEAPSVRLENVVTALREDVDTSQRIKVADIVVTDDALGTANLSLSGEDAALLVIDGLALYFEAGVDLDFETNPQINATVAVDDPAVGGTPDQTVDLAIDITDYATLAVTPDFEAISAGSRQITLSYQIQEFSGSEVSSTQVQLFFSAGIDIDVDAITAPDGTGVIASRVASVSDTNNLDNDLNTTNYIELNFSPLQVWDAKTAFLTIPFTTTDQFSGEAIVNVVINSPFDDVIDDLSVPSILVGSSPADIDGNDRATGADILLINQFLALEGNPDRATLLGEIANDIGVLVSGNELEASISEQLAKLDVDSNGVTNQGDTFLMSQYLLFHGLPTFETILYDVRNIFPGEVDPTKTGSELSSALNTLLAS